LTFATALVEHRFQNGRKIYEEFKVTGNRDHLDRSLPKVLRYQHRSPAARELLERTDIRKCDTAAMHSMTDTQPSVFVDTQDHQANDEFSIYGASRFHGAFFGMLRRRRVSSVGSRKRSSSCLARVTLSER